MEGYAMCTLVWVIKKKQSLFCETQGELAQVMPKGLVFTYGTYEPDICLCPVDIIATGRKNGYTYSTKGPDGTENMFEVFLYEA
jgi:hypothetical protein